MRSLGTHLPNDFKRMLRVINGTDLPAINIYGSSGEPHRTSVGAFSYPRDFSVVKDLSEGLSIDPKAIAAVLLKQGVELEDCADLVPI